MLKKLSLALLWLLFPPLFLVLAFVWKMPRMAARIILFVVAPITLVMLLATGVDLYNRYHQYVDRGSRSEIESKTGLKFPRYRTIDKREIIFKYPRGLDFTMKYKVQLDTARIREFYQAIETTAQPTAIDTLHMRPPGWRINSDGNYDFYDSGINHPDQQFLDITIDKSMHQATIVYGEW